MAPHKRPGGGQYRLELLAVLVLTAAGAVVRLLLWHTQSIVSVDGTTYIRTARALTHGTLLPSFLGYGYSLLIAAARPLTGDWIAAARGVDFLSGLALVPLGWLLARDRLKRPGLALVPAAALAFLPLPVRYSLTTMSESPYLLCLLVFFILYARRRLVAAGLTGGVAYLIRPEALIPVGIVVLSRIRAPREAARVALAAALLVAVQVVAIGTFRGVWTLSEKSVNIAADWRAVEEHVGEEPGTETVPARLHRVGKDVLEAYPPRLLIILRNTLEQGGWIAPLLALGVMAGGTRVLLGAALYIVLLPLGFVGERVRFVYPALPFLWIAAAEVVGRVSAARVRWVLAAMVAAGLVFTGVQQRPLYTLNEDGYFPELVRAGLWLHPFVASTTVVYGRKPYVAFYAGAENRYLPTGNYDEVLDTIRRDGGDFLVVNDWVMRHYRPELLPLATDPDTIEGETRAVPIYFDSSPRGIRTIIYRLVRPGGPPPIPDEDRIRRSIVRYLRGG